MVDIGILKFFGGIAYWIWNGFKGKFSDMMDKQYSAIVGIVFVTVLVLILVQFSQP